MMGFKIKLKGTHVESRSPNGSHHSEFGRRVAKVTKGLTNLKIKWDGLLVLCLTNPYRHRDPAESEPGLDGIKTISIPLNF
jgi:hypothetical protein